ncbi:uncharacterized protein LOC106882728 isoform X1 [Octopus bimaculoides]|uniref:uncharacterized protein LOC106882728 isoform X1 n=1 Tax=Octopus bimaculoides TaxID=37653 RepID=UPI0022E4757F|nr:uncharacterized protein LOC106882728 isoform X1 [Octopus bimaculoides]
MEMLLKTTLLVFGLLLAVLHSQASTTVPLSQVSLDKLALLNALNQANNEEVIDIDETHDNLHDISSDGSGDSDNDEEEEEEEESSGNDESTGSGVIDQAEITTVTDAPKIKALTRCQKHHKQNLNHSEEYLPQCTSIGEYKKMQCMVNVCWCVSRNGKLINGTKLTDAKPDCHKGTNLSPCVWELVKHSRGSPGSLRPSCTESGEYERVQCDGNKCWCTNKHGNKIKGSQVHLPKRPVCDAVKAVEVTTLKKIVAPQITTTTAKTVTVKGVLPKKPNVEPKLSTPRISISSVSTSSSEMSSAPNDKPIHEPRPNESATEEPGIMAAIIAGAVVGLFVCILLTMFIVYRMRKKDEGSYPLDEPTKSNYSYTKAPDKEFYA